MSAPSDSLKFNRPALFSPTVIRNITEDVNGISTFQKSDFSQVTDTALGHSASFKYSLSGDGLKSTQQLNVDWANFENHTFFNSARVKVQVAFDKIINQFPFDGTKKEYELFFDSLTGHEKYVYDQFPKYKGYLFFSGTNGEATGGTFVTVKDIAGTEFPTISKILNGSSILDPGLNSLTIEFQLYKPTQTTDTQVILYKVSGSGAGNQYGYSVNTSNKDADEAWVQFLVVSGAQNIALNMPYLKGQFNHIAFVWNRTPGVNTVLGYLNGELTATSTNSDQAGYYPGVTSQGNVEIGLLNCQSAPLIIGSGSVIRINSTQLVSASNTLSGALDELRIWHSARSKDELKESASKNIFADDDLKLYFKFNEPSGSSSNLVIDSSGKSLHGVLSTAAVIFSVREIPTGSVAGSDPLTYEKESICPILFPNHPGVNSLRTTMLAQAIEFDANNPNLITKLVPKHYLLEGQLQDAIETEEGPIVDSYENENEPRTGKLADTQLLLSLLWTWAKFFDEMKLYIQAFGDMYNVEYDSSDNIPDQFLQTLASRYGFKLPPLFNGTSIAQFVGGENIDNTINTGEYSLQYIQNQIWRRILINLRDISTSKGTIHSVKSFIRSVGIEPDNNFRIREFGGPTKKALSEARETKTEVATLVNFASGGLIRSPFLSGSRTEPGYPEISLVPAHISSNGLWTSGSWTYEAHYRFPTTSSLSSSVQSLMRMMTTGSHINATPGILLSNLTADSDGLRWYSNFGSDDDIVVSASVNILDGNPWYISVGRIRGDEIDSSVSSSFFLRAARVNHRGQIEEAISASVYANDNLHGSSSNSLQVINASLNASGVFIEIGKNENIDPSANPQYNTIDDDNVQTMFEGRIGQIRFWSKGLDENEWREHTRNFKSVGVQNPLVNFNFVTAVTGAWERLRMDISTDQQELETDSSGRIILFDYSQNNLHWSGTLFSATSSVVVPQRFYYSHISPKFDEAATVNKIRARSFLSASNIINSEGASYISAAPLYELERSEHPTDNTRFTIDFSVVDALNQDIINIFSTFDSLDNIIGNPELIFSMDYPKLEELRNVYFNRLTDKVNLKGFFEFFKWFDTNLGTFIAQLVPRKTKFLGTNFVIESHMLERPKMEYLYSDMYIGENHRHGLKDTILLQQFVGIFNKF